MSVERETETEEGLHRALGLTDEEYQEIVSSLGRAPRRAELAMYSLAWSEHCSYKSSRPHLGILPTSGSHVLSGPGGNAGVVDVGAGLAAVFKVESHNHPSFVEPFQGAATGVGGILRDVLAMGARPIATLDSLHFGMPQEPSTQALIEGVVAGVGHYGNCAGVATVGGEVCFDPCYAANPLVNVLTVGIMPVDRLMQARAERPGDLLVLFGAKTGRDGIGGASVLASASFGAQDESKRPNVQVGDPFQGKLLIEVCQQLVQGELLAGLQDLGAAGLTSAASEIAAVSGTGLRLDLDAVPLREPSMEAWEILISESQERMLAVVEPTQLDAVLAVCRHWGVLSSVIGEVTEDPQLLVSFRGEQVVALPVDGLTTAPTCSRPQAPTAAPNGDDNAPRTGDLRQAVLALVDDPALASKRWVYEQYDRMVGQATVAGPGGDGAIVRLPGTNRALVLSLDSAARIAALDPWLGAAMAVAEAARNVACTGARPLAVTNCLNFPSPQRPEVMGAFVRALEGMAAACTALGTPVTGGNVSFYNESAVGAIHPTPVVGVLGLLEDAAAAVPAAFPAPGLDLWLLGEDSSRLAGSAWQRVAGAALAGTPPTLDLDAEARLHGVLLAATKSGVLATAHDCSGGGLALALVEAALGGNVGARVALEGSEPLVTLVNEAPSRVLVSTLPARSDDLQHLCTQARVPLRRLGVTGGSAVVVDDSQLEIEELRERYEGALPHALGEDVVAGATGASPWHGRAQAVSG